MAILALWWVTTAYRGQNVWAGWEEAGGFRRPSYPETIRPAEVFRTRANTWSNLAYVLVGFYVLALARLDWRRPASRPGGHLVHTPGLSGLFAAACCLLGIGSGLFHASLSRIGQHLDVAAMYPPLLALIAISVSRRWPEFGGVGVVPRLPSWPWLAGLVALISGVLYRYKWSMSALAVLATLIVTLTALAGWDRVRAGRRLDGRWLLVGVGMLAAAVVCRQLDVARRFSSADSWFQGHAWWHVLTAASLAAMYAFYRDEREPEPPARAR